MMSEFTYTRMLWCLCVQRPEEHIDSPRYIWLYRHLLDMWLIMYDLDPSVILIIVQQAFLMTELLQ